MAIVNTRSGKAGRSATGERKEKHLTICTDPSRFRVEDSGAGFDGVRFLHDALADIAADELDTSVEFCGARAALPFFISCMTGGSEGGFRANRELAAAAQTLGIPVGLGSIRVLLENPGMFSDFDIKPLAPDVPVLANISAVQVRDGDMTALLSMVERLRAHALVVHLNPGQELFQPEGDRDFRGLLGVIARLSARSPLPVIVKETGFGILPRRARELFQAGAAYVDLAGAGGTNWISVESYRLSEEERGDAEDFQGWGIPTAPLLAAFRGGQERLLASGGIRTGMDAAKSLALGAEMAGVALPAIRAVTEGGAKAVVKLFRRMERTLRVVMVLTGSRSVADLRRGTLWMEPGFTQAAEAIALADHAAVTDGRIP
jgi:isopentenyl-diphosphate Delta-isomerase